jgi:flagella basal body P-ring formation protein FlgA
MPLIPAGARVRLWRKGDGASIELTGTALESGMAGQTIHVRTGSRGTVLEGQVRGEDSVELSNSAKWQGKLSDGWSQ